VDQKQNEKRLPYVSGEVYDRMRVHCIINGIEVKKFAEEAIVEKLDREELSKKVSRKET
jgi:hypothetical protein